MPEHEAYRPQSEHASEQPQNPSALETGHALPRPENEVASNPRIMALMQERDTAERRLQEAILDLETREQSPAFQRAKELLHEGLRIEYSGDYADPDYTVLVYRTSPNGLAKETIVFGVKPGYGGMADDFTSAYVHETGAEELLDSEEESQIQGNILDDLSLKERDDKWQVVMQLINLTAETSKTI